VNYQQIQNILDSEIASQLITRTKWWITY